MPDMNYRAPIAEGDVAMHKQRLRRLADAEIVRHIDNRFNGKMREHYDIDAILKVRNMAVQRQSYYRMGRPANLRSLRREIKNWLVGNRRENIDVELLRQRL